MKGPLIIFILFLFTCCIPVRIAPKIKEEKVKIAKRFKRHLPKTYSYIFKDPKDADEFYNYINTIYQLNHKDVEFNVPVLINKNEYFISFYEVEIPTETINLVPVLIDAKLESVGSSGILQDVYVTRKGTWYIVLTVSDSKMNDSLHPKYTNRQEVLTFLKKLRLEYLNTTDYLNIFLRK